MGSRDVSIRFHMSYSILIFAFENWTFAPMYFSSCLQLNFCCNKDLISYNLGCWYFSIRSHISQQLPAVKSLLSTSTTRAKGLNLAWTPWCIWLGYQLTGVPAIAYLDILRRTFRSCKFRWAVRTLLTVVRCRRVLVLGQGRQVSRQEGQDDNQVAC